MELTETLFKDEREMNHKSKLKQNLACIEKLIRTAGGVCGNNPILVEKLLGGARTEKKHHPDHALCDGCDSERMTEKRMCRCMYYFNSPEKKAVSNCDGCKLKYKWKNVGKIDIVEYEYPTEYVSETVGGIDLIIRDGEQEYAVEVKPEKSSETLARMFAEILTYTLEYENGAREPAICFFEGSEQWKEYFKLKLEGNKSLEYIEQFIKVYYFKVQEKGSVREFEILPIEGAM
jgi:hypothetical protein